MRVGEWRETPQEAKQVAAKCDRCGKFCFGERALIRAALEEHRRVCTAGGGEQQRVYQLWYPRK